MKAFDRRRILFLLGAGALAAAGAFSTRAGAVCVGDCDGSGQVLIPEVQRCINLERGLTSEPCANADQDLNGTVEADEVDLCLDSFLDAATCSMVFTPAAATSTPTAVPPTSTPTASHSPTRTNTPTGVPPTNTPTPTQAPPNTPTPTSTRTPTPTLSATSTRTNTATATRTHTPTSTPAATCPISAGIYTQTQTAGGALAVDGLTPFPFPSGGRIVQHVSAASAPECVHNTVVPASGGFVAPLFCIPGLNFSVQVQQDGCGVGRIDSNGGSDFTITEIGDTSSPTVCGLPASNCSTPPGDSNVQVNIQVGGNGPDVCASGTANASVSVPVHTITWSHAPLILCMTAGPDTTGPGGTGDQTVTEFDQILDFTTDTTSADWMDLDPDGCCLAGAGPGSQRPCAFGGGGGGPVGGTGTCINLAGTNVAGPDVTTVAAGTIGSNGSPLYDLTFSTTLPNEVSGPTGAATAACATPPGISFSPPGNIVTRCIP